MIKLVSRLSARRPRRAQGMTEYIIIVGLIAIVLITAIRKFQTSLNSVYETSTTKLEGIQGEIDASGS